MKQFNHKTVFFLLILLLPTQVGLHFWPSWASIFGIRVDYLSPTIYLTDVLVVGLLISWWWDKRKDIKILRYWDIKTVIFVVSLYLSLLVSILFVAQNQGVALYKLVKLVEFSLLGFYVFKNYTFYSLGSTIYFPLSIALVYSSLIAWLQFITGHTLGGPLWWLGERTFDVNVPGIALVNIGGVDYLRPYATFPHPNVLAGFLLVGLILLKSPSYPATQLQSKFLSVAWLLGCFGLIITFSHSAWLAGLVALFVYGMLSFRSLVSKYFVHIVLFVILLSLLFPFLTSAVNISTLSQEIGRRVELGRAAINMVVDYPLTGVGLGNFIVRLPEYGGTPAVSWWLQPVHNVFLLVLSETGLIGFGFVVWFLLLVLKKLENGNWKMAIPFLVILITGMADHYWLTLQQGQLMLAIVLGVGVSATIKK